MKNYISLLLLLCIGILALGSCDKDKSKLELTDGTTKSINVDNNTINKEIKFTSATQWAATLAQSPATAWSSIDKTSGEGGTNTISLTMSENTTSETATRTATITITSGDKTLVITVIQGEFVGDIILTDPTDKALNLSLEAHTKKIEFSTVNSWTAEFFGPKDVAWCSINDETGDGTGGTSSFVIKATKNTGDNYRKATITITSAAETLRIIVIQAGFEDFIILNDPTDKALTPTDKVYAKKVGFSTAKDWTTNVSGSGDVSWCSITDKTNETGGASSFVVNAKENTNLMERKATITITSGAKSSDITVTQAGIEDFIILNDSTDAALKPTSTAYEKTVGFSTARAWTVAVVQNAPNWCNVTEKTNETGGTGSRFVVNVEKSTEATSRKATITITSGTKTLDISVTQAGIEDFIILNDQADAALNLSAKVSAKTVGFNTARDWTVAVSGSGDVSWCSITERTNETGGSGSSFVVNVTENASPFQREGTAIITITSGTKTLDIIVTQRPAFEWALGNITCSDAACTGLKIADDPHERGLMFQWYGGNSDNNTIIGYPKGGNITTGSYGAAWNSTPRYVQPGGASFPHSWPSSNGVYNSWGTIKGEWTGNTPCTLIGNGWRLPTKAEILATHPLKAEWTWGKTGWTGSYSKGGYIKHNDTGLTFPMGGTRNYTNGSFNSQQGEDSWHWSSTELNENEAWHLHFNPNYGLHVCCNDKSNGMSVRCVRDLN